MTIITAISLITDVGGVVLAETTGRQSFVRESSSQTNIILTSPVEEKDPPLSVYHGITVKLCVGRIDSSNSSRSKRRNGNGS